MGNYNCSFYKSKFYILVVSYVLQREREFLLRKVELQKRNEIEKRAAADVASALESYEADNGDGYNAHYLMKSTIMSGSTISMTELFKIQGGMLPAVTAITILLATSFPDFFNSLAPSAETISLPLMQVFLKNP
ncbi:hypothetical protein F2Q69_00032037 [Brassica cretica]|uniref:Uncharacterized protein n=1 Tax=Brassica cretica TaxID=69181 RepID=A0A8S9S5A8_BRACR|nr:hypothetical protein F2Q69_00032037 [Brassica cretica]